MSIVYDCVFSRYKHVQTVATKLSLWQKTAYESLVNIAYTQTVIYFQTLKHEEQERPPEVSWCLSVTAPLTMSALTGLPVITTEIMQISHSACQQFFLAGAEHSKLVFELNSFPSLEIFVLPPVQINKRISPADISTKAQSCSCV